MPWATNSDLPSSVRGVLPAAAQTRFRTVANSVLASGGSDESAMRQAWHVVGQGWKKGKDGKWIRKASPKTLYVHRPVLNGQEIVDWAKSQGFKTTIPPEDLHVTIAFSKDKVAWDDVDPMDSFDTLRLAPDKNRKMDRFGEASVLRFEDKDLESRWQNFLDAGASWDHDGYKPHLTISWQGDWSDPEFDPKPYTGVIELGPEVWEEVVEDWADTIVEKEQMSKQLSTRVIKVDDTLGLVFGWAIICKENGEDYFDQQDDHIPEHAMLNAVTEYADGNRTHKIMHDGEPVGKVLFLMPLTTEIAKAFELQTKRTGLIIAAKPDNEECLAKFRSREYTGFSIGGRRIEDVEVADG